METGFDVWWRWTRLGDSHWGWMLIPNPYPYATREQAEKKCQKLARKHAELKPLFQVLPHGSPRPSL